MDVEEICNKYIKKLFDGNNCFCSTLLTFKNKHIRLFLKNDNLPKVQFLLSYYYYDYDEQRSLKYAMNAITGGIEYTHNILGLLEPENKLEHYEKASDVKYPNSYINLGIFYENDNDIDNAMKYYNMGLENGVNCCGCHILLHNNDIDMLWKCVDSEYCCFFVVNTLYGLTKDESLKYKLVKTGARHEFHKYFMILMNNYKKNNRFKYIALLEKNKKCRQPDILFSIANEYVEMGNNICAEYYLLRAIKYGNQKAFKHLGCQIPKSGIVEIIDILEIIIDREEKNKLIHEMNLSCIYIYSEKWNEAKKIINNIDSLYEKYTCFSRYYYCQNKFIKSHDYMLKAFEIDPLCERQLTYETVAMSYKNIGDTDKFIEFLEKGAERGEINPLAILISTALTEKKYNDAMKYLSKCSMKGREWKNLLNEIIVECDNVDIGKELLKKDISMGLIILLKTMSNDSIVNQFAEYFTYGECDICYDDEYKLLTFNCGHTMCINCFKKCGLSNFVCSFCKRNITMFIK